MGNKVSPNRPNLGKSIPGQDGFGPFGGKGGSAIATGEGSIAIGGRGGDSYGGNISTSPGISSISQSSQNDVVLKKTTK